MLSQLQFDWGTVFFLEGVYFYSSCRNLLMYFFFWNRSRRTYFSWGFRARALSTYLLRQTILLLNLGMLLSCYWKGFTFATLLGSFSTIPFWLKQNGIVGITTILGQGDLLFLLHHQCQWACTQIIISLIILCRLIEQSEICTFCVLLVLVSFNVSSVFKIFLLYSNCLNALSWKNRHLVTKSWLSFFFFTILSSKLFPTNNPWCPDHLAQKSARRRLEAEIPVYGFSFNIFDSFLRFPQIHSMGFGWFSHMRSCRIFRNLETIPLRILWQGACDCC
jgi:hypothetical protein